MIRTARLLLRSWRDADRAPFAAMSADPAVMRFLRPLPDRVASDGWIDRQQAAIDRNGFGFWALEVAATGAFAGAAGLARIEHPAPAVEVGWRLPRAAWGQGYATEAGHAALAFGFDTLGLAEIVAMAGIGNAASHRVMQRLGMTRDLAGDFDHPAIAAGDPLRRQMLFRIRRDAMPAASAADQRAQPPGTNT